MLNEAGDRCQDMGADHQITAGTFGGMVPENVSG